MKVGDFFVKLGFQFDASKVQQAEKTFSSLGKGLLALTGVVAGALYGIEKFVSGSAQQAQALQNLSNQTGIAVEEFQKMESLGQRVGLSAGVASAGISNLAKELTNIRMGQGNIAPFSQYGVQAFGANAFEVLGQIRARIDGLDESVATKVITDFGLTPDFINILKLSDKEFQRLSQNIFFKDGQKTLVKLNQSLVEMRLKMTALKDHISAKLAPTLIKLINDGLLWFDKNKGNIIRAISYITDTFKNFGQAVKNATSLLAELLEKIPGIENGFKALAVAIGLAVLGAKRLKLVLGIGLLDDIKVWTEGGETLFGRFYDSMARLSGALTNIFDGIKNIFANFWATIEPAIDKIINVGDVLANISKIIGSFFENEAIKVFIEARAEDLKDIRTGAVAGGVAGTVIPVPGAGTVGGALIGGMAVIFEKLINGFLKDQQFKKDFINQALERRSNETNQTTKEINVHNNITINADSVNSKDISREVYDGAKRGVENGLSVDNMQATYPNNFY